MEITITNMQVFIKWYEDGEQKQVAREDGEPLVFPLLDHSSNELNLPACSSTNSPCWPAGFADKLISMAPCTGWVKLIENLKSQTLGFLPPKLLQKATSVGSSSKASFFMSLSHSKQGLSAVAENWTSNLGKRCYSSSNKPTMKSIYPFPVWGLQAGLL